MKPEVAIVGRYYNQQGGVSNVMAQLASRATQNYNVSVASNEFLDWNPALRQLEVPMLARPRWAQIPSFALAALPRVKKSSARLIHAHDPQYLGADIYTAHSCFKGYIGSRRKAAKVPSRLASYIYPPHVVGVTMSNLAYNRAPLIVAVSQSIRDEMIVQHDLPGDKVRVVYNGVDLDKFDSQGKESCRKRIEEELGRSFSQKLLLIFVGYEFERKRLGVVLQAIRAAGQDNFHLLVAGGADPSKYRKLADDLGVANSVSFLGHRSDVANLMRASDAFVFPTKYEAASLAILEAAAAGLAVVTTGVAMAAEVFTDGYDALLVPNSDSHEAVTQCLKKLVADNVLLKTLGNNARRLALTFSWDSIWAQYNDIYAEILTEKAAR